LAVNHPSPARVVGLIKKNILETLVEVAGVEPAGESASFPVSKVDSAVLLEILTEISDKDRQMPRRIYENCI
jgi:hypothetical protein